MNSMNLAAGDGAGILFPILGEMVLGVIAFGLLCWLLMKFVFPMMEKTFAARVDAIEGGIERAKAAEEAANLMLEEYRRKIANASEEAAAIRDDARADAVAAKEEILANARDEANRVIAAGHAQIEASRQQLVTELRSEIGTLAVDLAGKIISRNVSGETVTEEAVDQFLVELNNAETTASGAR